MKRLYNIFKSLSKFKKAMCVLVLLCILANLYIIVNLSSICTQQEISKQNYIHSISEKIKSKEFDQVKSSEDNNFIISVVDSAPGQKSIQFIDKNTNNDNVTTVLLENHSSQIVIFKDLARYVTERTTEYFDFLTSLIILSFIMSAIWYIIFRKFELSWTMFLMQFMSAIVPICTSTSVNVNFNIIISSVAYIIFTIISLCMLSSLRTKKILL